MDTGSQLGIWIQGLNWEYGYRVSTGNMDTGSQLGIWIQGLNWEYGYRVSTGNMNTVCIQFSRDFIFANFANQRAFVKMKM